MIMTSFIKLNNTLPLKCSNPTPKNYDLRRIWICTNWSYSFSEQIVDEENFFYMYIFLCKTINPNCALISLQGIMIWTNLFLNYPRMFHPKLQLFLAVRFFEEFFKNGHGTCIYFYVKIRPPLWFHPLLSDRDFNKLKFSQPEILQHKLQLFLFR